ncbi:MAG: nucleotidyltransferase domain-containing protein [Deltaproteobacteria bacterium]|nr:nucleotidyltransferase domain-containing protein [Deltaproteobacteria bacterium]
MGQTPSNSVIEAITSVLSEDARVLFAYLYGSAARGEDGNDIDIAVFAAEGAEGHNLSADLKVALHKRIDLPPDAFDVRILNGLAEGGDIFGLLYLKNVLSGTQLLVDRNPDVRAEFIERYGTHFRECEGLMEEVLA